MQIEVTRAIAAPSGIVWAVITDLPNSPQVITGIDSVELLGGPQTFDVGTRWRETRTMFGKVAIEEMEVSAVTPGTSYSVVAASHGMHYESVFTLQPSGAAGCRLTMTFSGEPTTAASRAMAATVGRLFTGQTRKALEKDLADIAAAAEARAV
jgi:carbon monoxide dehydrogenase subunit G